MSREYRCQDCGGVAATSTVRGPVPKRCNACKRRRNTEKVLSWKEKKRGIVTTGDTHGSTDDGI